jgi:hypothetical protein
MSMLDKCARHKWSFQQIKADYNIIDSESSICSYFFLVFATVNPKHAPTIYPGGGSWTKSAKADVSQ